MPDQLTEVAKTFTVKELPESEVEFSGDIPVALIEPYQDKALKHIAEHLELPGFRPGKVPPEMALKKVGAMAALEEAVELAIQDLYPSLILEHKIDAVGRPEVRVTKLAPENPVSITVRTAVYPIIELPENWKVVGQSIALEEPAAVTDEDVTGTLETLRKNRATKNDKNEEVLPEINDEFAKSLGAFENVDMLKEQIKKGITEEKSRAAKDTRRGKIIDALLEKTNIAVPKIFVESEIDKIVSQMREDISRFGMTLEQYLERVKKTEADVRAEFKDQATKRAKLQLTLNKIAEVEKIEPDQATVDEEMKHAIEHFPDAKPDLLRIHIETVLRNDKVLQLLEENTKQ